MSFALVKIRLKRLPSVLFIRHTSMSISFVCVFVKMWFIVKESRYRHSRTAFLLHMPLHQIHHCTTITATTTIITTPLPARTTTTTLLQNFPPTLRPQLHQVKLQHTTRPSPINSSKNNYPTNTPVLNVNIKIKKKAG